MLSPPTNDADLVDKSKRADAQFLEVSLINSDGSSMIPDTTLAVDNRSSEDESCFLSVEKRALQVRSRIVNDLL